MIVAGNMFGDIVSDGFAGLIGGLGFACSANSRPMTLLYLNPPMAPPRNMPINPVSIVNPIAMIVSAVMMLEYIGEG